MTRDELQQLGETGRELDALIAQKIFELPVMKLKDAPCPYCGDEMRFCGERSRCVTCNEWRYSPYKEYSDEIESAWEVVDKVYIHSLRRIVNDEPDRPALWQAFVYANSTLSGIGETAPLAICRAALLAVMGT